MAGIAFASVFGGLRSAVVDLSRPVASVVVALTFPSVVWMFTPWLLLSRRIPWRALVPAAALTAICMTALSITRILYMPDSISGSAARYGTIGVAVSLVSWFVAAGFILVGCAAVGAVLGERQATTPTPAPSAAEPGIAVAD